MTSRELAAMRVKHLLNQGIAGGIEVITVSHDSNSHGEWLFITLQARNPLSDSPLDQWLQLTVYGLGYDFSREQWVDHFRFAGKTSRQPQIADASVLQLSELWKEAEADVRIGLQEPSSRGECHILLSSGEISDGINLLDEFEKNHQAQTDT
ncbi:MAG: hypothetical protein ACE5OZ_05700 [Candidatus Heimdallarchaeota archaeon]